MAADWQEFAGLHCARARGIRNNIPAFPLTAGAKTKVSLLTTVTADDVTPDVRR
jgi:hypothetical protein